jgi:hypothetical protein
MFVMIIVLAYAEELKVDRFDPYSPSYLNDDHSVPS